MTRVGVRALKSSFSEYLKRATAGERIVVTHRGRAVAVLSRAEEPESDRGAWKLVDSGRARWVGGKPAGMATAPHLSGSRAAGIVLEDRR